MITCKHILGQYRFHISAYATLFTMEKLQHKFSYVSKQKKAHVYIRYGYRFNFPD